MSKPRKILPPQQWDESIPRFKHEYNGAGQHRIVGPMAVGPIGDWFAFNEVARLPIGESNLYVAFSDYYEGAFPVNRVFKLNECPTESR